MSRSSHYSSNTKKTGTMTSIAAIKTLLPYLWPKNNKGLQTRVIVAVILLFAAKSLNSYFPILYKRAVDSLSAQDGILMALPLGVILAYGGTRLGVVAFNELRDSLFARVQQYAIRTSGVQVFKHLMQLSLRFHLNRQTGGVTRSIERGTRAIDTMLNFLVFSLFPTFFEIILVTILLWHFFNGWYALVTSLTIIAYATYTFIITEWRTKFYREMNEDENKANSQAIDSLLNYETVKYFNNDRLEAKKYNELLYKLENSSVKSQFTLSMLNVGQSFIITTGLTIMMLMAAKGIQQGTMTVGDFVMVNTYLLQLYQPLNGLGFIYRAIKRSFTDMENMFDMLNQPAEVQDKPDAEPLIVTGGKVQYEHVSFGYDERRPIIKDVSFTIEAGQTLAIVGPSGSGKSTLARLLFRFYDVTKGRILIDHQNIAEVTQESLRSQIGIVPQDTVLFNDTIENNIAYGRPTASHNEMEHAAKSAHIHEMVMEMPDQYNTVVGERGLKLSGGEKQRVAIARTILKAPKIFIFDEATSALDTRTEQAIQTSLREMSAGHSTLVIAHRLSTVVDADKIIVLNHGEIAEEGTHQELLKKGAIYAAMWAQQVKEGEAEYIVEHTPPLNSLASPS